MGDQKLNCCQLTYTVSMKQRVIGIMTRTYNSGADKMLFPVMKAVWAKT
jgi:hypothetical protein